MTMHILVADDFAHVRRGLRETLVGVFPHARFAEAANGDEVMSVLDESNFSLPTLDLNMPGRSGIEVLRDVRGFYPNLPVIIVSSQPEEQYAAACLKAGATAYIQKDRAPEELAQTAKAILGWAWLAGPQFECP
jgi:DNA-binding NarL/FixJ family response regulator